MNSHLHPILETRTQRVTAWLLTVIGEFLLALVSFSAFGFSWEGGVVVALIGPVIIAGLLLRVGRRNTHWSGF